MILGPFCYLTYEGWWLAHFLGNEDAAVAGILRGCLPTLLGRLEQPKALNEGSRVEGIVSGAFSRPERVRQPSQSREPYRR